MGKRVAWQLSSFFQFNTVDQHVIFCGYGYGELKNFHCVLLGALDSSFVIRVYSTNCRGGIHSEAS